MSSTVDENLTFLRIAKPLKQCQCRAFSGAGRTDKRKRLARFCLEGQIEDTLLRVGEAVGRVIELDMPLHILEGNRARFLECAAACIEKLEKIRERRRLQENASDKAGEHVELADEKIGETDKGHDLANRDLTALGQDGSDCENGDHRYGCRGPGEHGQHRPPCQHGILRTKKVGHERAKRARFGKKPRIALHHGYVADHIAHAAKNILMILLDAFLAAVSPLDDDRVGKKIEDGQRGEKRGQAKVDGNAAGIRSTIPTIAVRCSRKKESHKAKSWSVPASMIRTTRPDPCSA